MISLSEKFLAENSKDRNTPTLLVEILFHLLSNEQTTQSDWAANSGENNVDYTPDPPASGDVILASDAVPNEENQTSDSWGALQVITSLQGLVTDNINWQSFKQTTGGNKTLGVVQGYFRQATGSGTMKVSCQIWSAGKSAQIGTTIGPVNITSDTGQWLSFDFSSQGIVLQNDTEYWIRLNGSYSGVTANISEQRYQSTNVYAKGQFDRTGTYPGTNLGDLAFIISMSGSYYQPSGYIRTQTMDLVDVPTNEGEWVIEDIQPAGTALSYQAWASDTGAFAGEETNLGAIADGEAITVLKRYYRVRADFSTTNQSNTPTLQLIKAQFEIYNTYSDNMSLGYEPAVLSVSSLTTTIDTFEKSTISQIDLAMGLTESVSAWLKTKYPRNKIVRVRAGFVAPGWSAADYENYFRGQVEDWQIETDFGVKLQIQDYAKEWKAMVPAKWESVFDDVTWTDMHPVDVCLDILRNHINVRDSKLVLGSFEAVKVALSGWKVSRTVTGDTVDADELLQELRILMSCYFIPQADGRIKIKRWGPGEAAVDSLTDDDMANVRWEANAASLINQTHIYYGWDGDGDKAQDFTDLRVAPDAASQANWNELRIKEIKDKWTRPTETGQVQDLESRILARFADPPSIISCEVARSRIYLEVGDIVTVTTKKAPSTDMGGITNERYQVINRNLDFKKDVIRLKLLAVAGGY